jgi:Protein of unknown function (DUF3768)
MSAVPTASCALGAAVFTPPNPITPSPGPSTVGASVAANGFALASPTTTETTMTTEIKSTKTDLIRALNDELRKNFSQGHAVMTTGITALGAEAVARIVKTIGVYDDFCHASDPYEEHDFGSFEAEGHMIFFKIDYYDPTLTVHSPDPSDPIVTKRVIMLAEEY